MTGRSAAETAECVSNPVGVPFLFEIDWQRLFKLVRHGNGIGSPPWLDSQRWSSGEGTRYSVSTNSYLPRRSLDFEEIFQVFELLQWFPIICIQVEIYTVMGHCHDYWAEPNRESVSYQNV